MTNLKHLLLLSGKQQIEVATEVGVKKSTFSDWYNGKSYPRADALQRLANYFDVNVEDLIRDYGEEASSSKREIPMYSKIQIDDGKIDMDLIIGYQEIPERLAKTGEFFALKVKTDEQAPMINAGDILIVREQDTLINGDIGILKIGGEEATVHKVSVNEFGITLLPNDYKSSTIFYNNKEIRSIPILILGKVIEARRKF
jgi:repressor LexA